MVLVPKCFTCFLFKAQVPQFSTCYSIPFSPMPRCKRARPLSDDDSDGPGASAMDRHGWHRETFEMTKSSEASDTSVLTDTSVSETPLEVHETAEVPEAEAVHGDEINEIDSKVTRVKRVKRGRASKREAFKAQPSEDPEVTAEMSFACPKPRSKFVSLLWEFASPHGPLLAVDVD